MISRTLYFFRCRYVFFTYVNDVEGFWNKLRLFVLALIVVVPKRFRLQYPFFLFLENRLVKGIVLRRFNKLFRLSCFDDISHLREDYESEIRDWFEVEEGDVFVDVGANIGFYSVLLSDRAKTVLAFEPCFETYNLLVDNIHLNKIENIHPFPFALSNHRGVASLNITPHSGHNSLKVVEDQVLRKQKAFLVTFDDFYFCGHVDLVKIDVEGAEFDVLEGMSETLRKHKPRLIIEVKEPNFESVVNFLHFLDYHIIDRKGENVYAISHLSEM